MHNFISHQFRWKNSEPPSFSLISKENIPQIAKHLLIKLPDHHQNRAELEAFKENIEHNQLGLHQRPYTTKKFNVTLYKAIFFSFASLFAFLACFVTSTEASFTYGFYNLSIAIKIFLALICALLSLTSFAIAIAIRTEREATIHYAQAAKASVSKFYARKRVEMGIRRFFSFFCPPQYQANALKHLYHETCDAIDHHKEETLHIVQQVRSTTAIDSQTKEMLYNQAIADFNNKLTLLVKTFKQSIPLRFNDY